jgi:hypothetical protein
MFATKGVKTSPNSIPNPELKRAHMIWAIVILVVSGLLFLIWTGAILGWAFVLFKMLVHT